MEKEGQADIVSISRVSFLANLRASAQKRLQL